MNFEKVTATTAFSAVYHDWRTDDLLQFYFVAFHPVFYRRTNEQTSSLQTITFLVVYQDWRTDYLLQFYFATFLPIFYRWTNELREYDYKLLSFLALYQDWWTDDLLQFYIATFLPVFYRWTDEQTSRMRLQIISFSRCLSRLTRERAASI